MDCKEGHRQKCTAKGERMGPGRERKAWGAVCGRSCEYRRLQRCAPYGIYTKPPKGTPVLVLGSQGGEVCLGAVSDPSAEEELLQEGEILIRSAGGASIRLCKDGRLLLNGREWKQEG